MPWASENLFLLLDSHNPFLFFSFLFSLSSVTLHLRGGLAPLETFLPATRDTWQEREKPGLELFFALSPLPVPGGTFCVNLPEKSSEVCCCRCWSCIQMALALFLFFFLPTSLSITGTKLAFSPSYQFHTCPPSFPDVAARTRTEVPARSIPPYPLSHKRFEVTIPLTSYLPYQPRKNQRKKREQIN